MTTATLSKTDAIAPASSPSYKLCPRHQSEWERGSGVSREITKRNVFSLNDNEEIADFIGWKGYYGPDGWGVTGIDPWTGQKRKIGQFKPDKPVYSPKTKKHAKYLTHKTELYTPIFLDTGDPEYWLRVAEDIGIDIFFPEGGKKAGVLLTHGYAAIGLCGVWMFQEDKKLLPDLKRIKWKGRRVFIPFDADIDEKKGVQEAALLLGQLLQKEGADVYMVLWKKELGKGVDDLIVQQRIVAFNRVKEEAVRFDDWVPADPDIAKKKAKASKGDDNPDKKPKANKTALELVEQHNAKWLWREEVQSWYQYSHKDVGAWSTRPYNGIKSLLAEILQSDPQLKEEFSQNYLKEVIEHLQDNLYIEEWKEVKSSEMLPLKDGVLDLKTQQLLEHSPDHRFTWQSSINWKDKDKGCAPIQNWLLQACSGHYDRVQVIRAALKMTLTARTDLHKFFEVVGPAGSGKSTLIKLMTALVGMQNVFATRLRELEENRFEVAGAIDAIAAVISDSDDYGGFVSTLKALTGGDSIRLEKKYKDVIKSFKPRCTVWISANESIKSKDYTNGLARRRVVIPFTNVIPEHLHRDLIDFEGGEVVGEFAPYLAGLLAWVLAMPDSEMVSYLKNTHFAAPSLRQAEVDTLIETNPMAAWAEECLVYTKSEMGTRIGAGLNERSDNDSGRFPGWETRLYPNYCHWCSRNNHHPFSMQKFSTLFLDLLQNRLKLKECKKEKTEYGFVITHILIKGANTHLPGLVFDTLLPETEDSCIPPEDLLKAETLATANPAYPAYLSEKVLEKVDEVDLPESPLPVLEPEPPLLEKCSEECAECAELAEATLSASSGYAGGVQGMQPTNDDELKVGDKVRWSKCPNHCEWAAPFEILRIKGKLAQLELIEEPVALCELSKI